MAESRFISGGTVDEPTERDEAWLKAQRELEATAIAKQEAAKQDGGKSLYETLQANKAAKQEAFEESIRLKNQFRSLDEDEVDFLDSVLESTRRKESEVKAQTAAELELFRRQQEEAEQSGAVEETAEPAQPTETWTTSGRKRKKGREKDALGRIKFRRTSTAETSKIPAASAAKAPDAGADPSSLGPTEDQTNELHDRAATAAGSDSHETMLDMAEADSSLSTITTTGIGLVDYTSDEDD